MSFATIHIKLDTRELERIANGLNTSTKKVLHRVAFQIEGDAKDRAPVMTGALKNSLYTDTGEGSGYSQASAAAKALRPGVETEEAPHPSGDIAAVVSACVEYAAYVELGTSKMSSREYLKPAAEKAAKKLNDGSTWQELFNP